MDEPQVTFVVPPADDTPPRKIDPTPVDSGPQEPAGEPTEPKKRGRPKGTTTAKRTPALHRELAEFLAMFGLAFQMAGQDFPAYVWTVRSEPFAHAVADLAEKNPALKAKIIKLMEGGAYGAVIWTGAALIIPILCFYGLFPQGSNMFQLSPHEHADYEAMMAMRHARVTPVDGSVPHPIS